MQESSSDILTMSRVEELDRVLEEFQDMANLLSGDYPTFRPEIVSPVNNMPKILPTKFSDLAILILKQVKYRFLASWILGKSFMTIHSKNVTF